MTYALIPIALASLLGYGFTLLISRAGLVSRTFHRRLWNTILLITFFVTAVLGIILAIQVNYKLEMPIVDKLIVWHVDFGIGMSFTAIFHFTWHWSYYWKIIAGKRMPLPGKEETGPGNNTLPTRNIPLSDKFPLVTLGATAMITQVIFLREFLAIFHGNELVIGIILACWLILTGTGALTGRNISSRHLQGNFTSAAFLLLGLLPLLTVFFIRFFKNMVFPLGSLAGIPGILVYSLATMSLFCLLSGFLFTFLSTKISIRHASNLIPFSYAAESAGSIAAGILFSFLLVYILDTFQILFLILLLNLGTALAGTAVRKRKSIATVSVLAAIAVAVIVYGLDIDLLSRSFLYKNQEVIKVCDTPYGNLVVSESAGQINLFDNSSPVSYSTDIASVEEDVHYAMLQHAEPRKVLVLSGDLPGLIAEIDKYTVSRVDYVEMNPWITRYREAYFPFAQKKWLNIVHMDGRRWLDATDQDYDVVLINLSPPGSARLNRFYTLEFLQQVKSHMDGEAVLSIPLQGTENYMSNEAGELFSILYHTMRQVFKNVLLVPGYKTYFLATDADLTIDIPLLVDIREINTVYVNSFYLDGSMLKMRSEQLMAGISVTPVINRDFHPKAFFVQISLWLSYYKTSLWISLGIVLLLIFLIGFRGGPLGRGIFITGFTGLGVEIVILLASQVVFGYVYIYTAVVLTVFMTGLALGSLFAGRIIPLPSGRYFGMLQIILAACVFLVLWGLFLIDGFHLPNLILHLGFLSLTFATAFVSGLLFATAAQLRKRGITETSGGLYSSDLAGSAAGALIMSVLLVPLAGMTTSLLILLTINLLGSLNSLLSKHVI